MPITLVAPMTIVPPVVADAISILSTSINSQAGEIRIIYATGMMDTTTAPAKFVATPGVPAQELVLNGQAYIDVVTANIATYTALKNALYATVCAACGIANSTIV